MNSCVRRCLPDRSPVDCLTQAGKGALEAAVFEEVRRRFKSALSRQTLLIKE
jgi:hypothetical protein